MNDKEDMMTQCREQQNKICDAIDNQVNHLKKLTMSSDESTGIMSTVLIGLFAMRLQNHLRQISSVMEMAHEKMEGEIKKAEAKKKE